MEEGELRFEADEDCEGEDIGISASTDSVLTEISRRLELWEKIREKIPSMSTAFTMAAGPGDKSLEIHLKPREWMLLCHLHGSRTVQELIELTGYTDFETAQTLYGMFSVGLIDKVPGLGEGSAAGV